MESTLKIKKKNDSDILVELKIDDSRHRTKTDKSIDMLMGGATSLDMDTYLLIARKEFEYDLDCHSAEMLNENEFIYSTDLQLCPPDQRGDANTDTYPQQKGHVLHWPTIISAELEETLCTVELYVFYRDSMGNIEKLHPDYCAVDLLIPHNREEYGFIEVNVSRQDGKAMKCGRYYTAFRLRRKDLSYVDKPVISYVNIVPAKGTLAPVQSDLVGMDSVFRQMSVLAKQKIFNDNRSAMNLSMTPVNLHAAVMGGKGSGKTSFAHVLYDFYNRNGFITEGKLRIVDAAKWVNAAEDTGRMDDDISSAENGMLYVENAGSMLPSIDYKGNKKYVVQALVRRLRDNSISTCLVLADHPDRLTEVLATEDLKSYIGQIYHLPELNLAQMMEVAERECQVRGFILPPETKKAMKTYLASMVDANSTEVLRLIDSMVMNMSVRVVNGMQDLFQNKEVLSVLMPEDIPHPEVEDYDASVSKLNRLVGLNKLKYSIESHLNLVRFAQLRSQNGLPSAMPPLHMIFTGNPGTGKTTVANLLGEIYASLGILKTGHVIQVDRKSLVGQYIGDTEENTKRALQRAHGNILFIDEAYTLVGDPNDKKDFGPKVLDCLLEELSKEKTDMIIIMAGYPDEMEMLLKSNKGLSSRFPYTFHFEDYTEDELIEIAKLTAQQSGFVFSDEALDRIRELVRKERERTSRSKEDKHFGNARFITRLISAYILPNMSRRVLAADESSPSKQYLSRIEAKDIPASATDTSFPIDEVLITRTLQELDRMAGLQEVKKTLHNLVEIARSRQLNGDDLIETIPLQWTFTGSTGTGKSSVARLLAQLMHAFHLISSDRMTQLRMPQTQATTWTAYDIDQILRDTMKQSGQGLLFIDLDDVANSHIDIQWLRCKLTSLTAEMPGSYAFVIAVDDHRISPRPIDAPMSTSILHFDDYTADELMEILQLRLDKHAFCLSDEAREEVALHIQNLCNNRSTGLANARTIRHIYTAITSAAELRALQNGISASPTLITKEDIQSFRWKPVTTHRIGFSA